MVDILKDKVNDSLNIEGYLRAEEFMGVYDELKYLITTVEDIEDKHTTDINKQVRKVVDILIKTNTYIDVGDKNNLTLIRPSVKENPEVLTDGITFNFIPKYTNTESATIQLGTLPRKKILLNGEELLDNELKENMLHTAKYNEEKDVYELIFINPGVSNNIKRPIIIVPEHFQVNFSGVIKSSDFIPVDTKFLGKHTGSNWVLSTDPDFNNIVDKQDNTINGLTHYTPPVTLGVGDYYVKVQYISNDLKSTWSKVTKFTTPAIYVQTPIIKITNSLDYKDVPEEAEFRTQPFAVTGESGTHKATTWRLKNSDGEVIFKLENSTTALRVIRLPEQLLQAKQVYTMECIYHGVNSKNNVIVSETGMCTFYTKDSYFSIPTLEGTDEVNEGDITEVIIKNYRSYYDYEILFDKENCTRNGDRLTWNVGLVNFDKIKSIGVIAKYKEDISEPAVHTLIVKDIPTEEPILIGPYEATEGDVITVKISNYNSRYKYEFVYPVDNCTINGDTITWKLKEVNVDSLGRIAITAYYNNDKTAAAEHVVLIKRRPLEAPIITGPDTVNEETTVTFQIANFQTDVTYEVSASLGDLTFNKNNGDIVITFPNIDINTTCTIEVLSRKDTETTTKVTKEVNVILVNVEEDDTISITYFNANSYASNIYYNNKKSLTKEELLDLIDIYTRTDDRYVRDMIINADTSAITNMDDLFKNRYEFNLPIGNWDVSNVTSMVNMFRDAHNFNQDISKWDVSKVTDMSYMFSNAYVFNQAIGSWSVGNTKSTKYMFSNAHSFNTELDWYLVNVEDVSYMFSGATSFNGSLTSFEIGSTCTNTSYMFADAVSFGGITLEATKWNMSNVTNMEAMFKNVYSLTGNGLTDWDVSKVTNMNMMFMNSSSFNQNISSWNVSNVTTHIDFDTGATSFLDDNKPVFNN